MRYKLDELRQILNNSEQVGGGRGIFVISPGPLSPFMRSPCPSHLSLCFCSSPSPSREAQRTLNLLPPPCASPANQGGTTMVPVRHQHHHQLLHFLSPSEHHLHLLLTSHAAITTESSPQSASPVVGDHLARRPSKNRPWAGRFWREDGSNARPNSQMHCKILTSILLKVESPPQILPNRV